MTTLCRKHPHHSIDGSLTIARRWLKRAFADATLQHIPLSSANSINIGRVTATKRLLLLRGVTRGAAGRAGGILRAER